MYRKSIFARETLEGRQEEKARVNCGPCRSRIALDSRYGAPLTGSVFGLIGSYAHPAEVAAQRANCSGSGVGLSCTVYLLTWELEARERLPPPNLKPEG